MERVRIIATPRSDDAFAAGAQRIAARIPADLAGEAALRWYEAELRRAFPDASVHEQEELARNEGDPPVWYASNRPRAFRIDSSVEVPLPPRDAYVVYVERVVEWQNAVRLRAPVPPGSLVGREYAATYAFLGRTFGGTFRVLAADPPRTVTVQAVGSGISMWYEAGFEPSADGSATLVTVRGDYELPVSALARVADRLGLERAIDRDIERANASFRRLCEAVADATRSGAPAGERLPLG